MKNLTIVIRDPEYHGGPDDHLVPGTKRPALPTCCKCGKVDAMVDRGDYYECRWDFDCGHVIHKDDCRIVEVASYDELAHLIGDLCKVLHADGLGILKNYRLSFTKVI
jgi:hypothetical protein